MHDKEINPASAILINCTEKRFTILRKLDYLFG